MEKKMLIINSALCDTRSVTEEILNSYESIEINRHYIGIRKIRNCSPLSCDSKYVCDMIEANEDVEVSVQNGHYVISKGTIMSKPTILMVNGSTD